MRCIVIIDGEHYLPVIESAIQATEDAGDQVLAAVLAGGGEKLPRGRQAAIAGVQLRSGGDPLVLLDRAIEELSPEVVVDLSDEPVLGYRRRHEMASVALARNVSYRGADFVFQPPARPRIATKPSVAIIGTGKRTGKTAVAGFAARSLVAAGRHPIVVAMGRGGPPEPDVIRGDEVSLDPADLVQLADSGKHAASDYVEDSMLGRVATVGCFRCGGGLAGAVAFSNVGRGIEIANEIEGDILLLEGSGAAIPPAHADVTVMIAPSWISLEHIAGYMGPYRLLLSDFFVVTMCEEPFGSASQISSVTACVQGTLGDVRRGKGLEGIRVVRTVFRPKPTRSVEGAVVYAATTAPKQAGESITRHLEERHGCKVLGISHALADRETLEKELEAAMGPADVLLCEIKAAGVDVATRMALDAGIEVVYMDNVPEGIDGDDPHEVFAAAADLATKRFEAGPQ